jgi:YaiO family outer membrane protein
MMIEPLSILAILLIIAALNCCGQDSIKAYLNSVEANVRYEHYPRSLNRMYLYLQYGRKVGPADIFAKVLRFSRGKNDAYLFESEAYIKFKKNGYTYFDAAYSASVLLPNYRLRAEIFKNWRRFEYSVGLGVVKPKNFESIPLLTGTIGYYFSDYFIFARPTFSYVDDGLSKSFSVQARRYFNKTDFLALTA